MKVDEVAAELGVSNSYSRQNVDKSKSADQISETDSGRQVQRYIRLTYLLPELLKLVRLDSGGLFFLSVS